MKTLLLSATLASVAFSFSAPAFAASEALAMQAQQSIDEVISSEFDKKKRKRGGKVRVPGGSGCDDPGDILEHPECRG